MAQGAGPVGDGEGPFGADFFEAQVEELEKRVDGFVGVDDFADLRGKVEEGGELVPVGLPAAADGEVLGIVGGAEGFKRAPGGLFGGGAVPACVGEVSGSGRVGLCGSRVRGEESPLAGDAYAVTALRSSFRPLFSMK